MINTESVATQIFNLPLYNAASGNVLADFNFVVLKDGAADSTVPEITEPVNNYYNAAFTFTSEGRYSVFESNILVASVRVVDRDSYAFLQDIEDVALGSWEWNKASGKLNFLRANGDPLAEFDVVEDSAVASRERV